MFFWCKWKFDNFFIHFWKRGTRKRFLEGEKSFLFPLFQKFKKKSKCQQQKIWKLFFNFLFLDLCIWFQYKNMEITGSHTFVNACAWKKECSFRINFTPYFFWKIARTVNQNWKLYGKQQSVFISIYGLQQ